MLTSLSGISVRPDPPHTNMMHVFLEGDAERLLAARDRVAADHDVELFRSLGTTEVPGVHRFELTVGDAALEFGVDEIRDLFTQLMGYTRQ